MKQPTNILIEENSFKSHTKGNFLSNKRKQTLQQQEQQQMRAQRSLS